jgi:hypothetical protein
MDRVVSISNRLIVDDESSVACFNVVTVYLSALTDEVIKILRAAVSPAEIET